MNVKELRLSRGWSQEQLAEASGLSVRTIQRIETGTQPGLASLAALRKVFGDQVDEVGQVDQLGAAGAGSDDVLASPVSFFDAIRICISKYAELDGHAGRAEYWWFFLFVTLVVSAGALISEAVGGLVLLGLALPLIAVGCRRLRDAGQSPWWQLMGLAPFGGVVPLIMFTFPSIAEQDAVSPRPGSVQNSTVQASPAQE